jgi:hypothetical protein
MATFYSQIRTGLRWKMPAIALLFFFFLRAIHAAESNKTYAERARNAFQVAQKNFAADTNNVTNAWNFARTCFDAATLAADDTQEADFARRGIAAIEPLLKSHPQSAPLHYYLAMNYGELADAQAPSFASYHLVHEMETEFKTADALDRQLDFAGPSRNLGELYYQAPGWPLSVGSKRKAREFLERAVKVAPNYPENILNLAEAELKWRDRAGADRTLKKLEVIWSAAQTNFTGEAWEQSWDDWRSRRANATNEFQKVFKSAP